MTVLYSRPDLPADDDSGTPGGDPAVLISPSGVSMPPVEDLGAGRGPDWLDGWLAANSGDVLAWFRHLHANPELSRQEFATTELVAGLLKSAGLQPQVLPGGTGLVCDIGTGGRCVALRADMDALPMTEATGLPHAATEPGACHACGHDAHTTILLATALALASAPELPGRIRLIFQPAEEVMPGGALEVIDAGGLDGVDRIFGLHCDPRLEVGRVGTRVGAITSATDLLELHLTSPGGHTSRPHLTADLVHALGTVITGLPALLSRRVDPRSGTVLVWGAVHAGEAPNAVPREGLLRGTLRTGDHSIWAELEPLVAGLVQSLLVPTGVGYDLHHRRGVPPVLNDADSTEILDNAVAAALGEGALTTTNQSSGGEDFGWYLQHRAGSFMRLGVWPGEGPMRDLHQPTFQLDERALLTGVRVMTHTALAALA
ncbi:N-acyl-L-amino acid amidohydrolase AmiA1 [Actinokineospora spheciospongiae]|uniref:N-acyl-L-amino acid amidohydrolase AmiA1 n=1 Tax=Actinokineospora spheciospongiae TaxID=909613 RepID=W7IK71_9PSEU|nr:amidohydrolase [Actinokineospora spheciospongiae]EWC60743.1 N-acyl-L-amino acid amidohydrolase AmiA1 [Actinokineospora spheciospongiae]